MPVIIFEGSPMNRDQKEQLVRELVSAASRVTSLPPEKFTTLIKENPPENVGVGTSLLADIRKG